MSLRLALNNTASLQDYMVLKKQRVIPPLKGKQRAKRKWTAGFWHEWQYQLEYRWESR